MWNIFTNINYWNCRLKLKIVIKNVIFLFSNKTLSKVKSEKNEQIFTHNNINLKKNTDNNKLVPGDRSSPAPLVAEIEKKKQSV